MGGEALRCKPIPANACVGSFKLDVKRAVAPIVEAKVLAVATSKEVMSHACSQCAPYPCAVLKSFAPRRLLPLLQYEESYCNVVDPPFSCAMSES